MEAKARRRENVYLLDGRIGVEWSGVGLFRDGLDQGHMEVNVKTKKRQKKAKH